jgi:hypothetical protein
MRWSFEFMKDVMELLRAKEQELSKVRKQVDALRVALPLLAGEEDPLVPPNVVSSNIVPANVKHSN